MDIIDACGLSCPQPVLMAKKALAKNPKKLEIKIDNNAAKINVTRYLESHNYSTNIKSLNDEFVIEAKRL